MVSQPRTETRNDYQVAVIGFGPSGAVATSLLGSYGIRTLTVDRLNGVYDKPRAIAIDHEILRLFDNLGVADRVLPFVAPFPASQHFGAEGQLIRRIDMVPEPYPLGYTPSMVFTQPPVEEALRDHAASYNSVDISLGTDLLELRQSVNGVTLNMRRDGSEARTVTADYVIACDGASSGVREQLEITLEDLVFDEPWLVVDVLVNEDALGKLPETAAQYCNPARPTTYIIGPGNHRRWEIMLLPDEDPRAAQQPEEVWKLLSKWLTPDDATLWRAASYRFHALVAREWRRGRTFLAGDAAHQQPPFIGQGMCQGLRDVSNLIWKLARVIKGESDDTLLDTYAEERSEHVRQLTTRIKAIGKVICERDPEAARERDARILAEGGGQPRTITRQEIVPPLQKGLLATRDDGVRGTLFPQPWVQTSSGRSLLDRVVGTGWRLFLDHGNFPGLSEDAQRQADDLGLHVIKVGMAKEPASAGPSEAHDAVVELDNVLAKWFESHGCRAAIVRPDHYVFGAAPDEGSLSNLMADLRARLQPTNARIPHPENSSVPYHARTGP